MPAYCYHNLTTARRFPQAIIHTIARTIEATRKDCRALLDILPPPNAHVVRSHTSAKPTMSSHEVLSAAANDRKSRLAHLKSVSLKRKQAPTDDEPSAPPAESSTATSTALTRTSPPSTDVTQTYLSGRNYDPSTRNVKLGFESAPIGDQEKTLEYRAEQLALESKAQQAQEAADDTGLDLFKLQPKRPNWDLKRDLEAKMEGLNTQTENAIARMVRERVEAQRKARVKSAEVRNGGGSSAGAVDGGEEVGMEGSELVEAMHLKEREEEEERRREEEDVS